MSLLIRRELFDIVWHVWADSLVHTKTYLFTYTHTTRLYSNYQQIWVLWYINHCRLFNAKSIFMQMNFSISNNSV